MVFGGPSGTNPCKRAPLRPSHGPKKTGTLDSSSGFTKSMDKKMETNSGLDFDLNIHNPLFYETTDASSSSKTHNGFSSSNLLDLTTNLSVSAPTTQAELVNQVDNDQFDGLQTYVEDSGDDNWCEKESRGTTSYTNEDKWGKIPVSEQDTKNLENLIKGWDLRDLPFSGPYFTWTNKQVGENLVMERINRALVNEGKKAPGPDDFTGLFFQSYWDIVGVSVTQMVKQFFETEHLLTQFNHTNLALIPKNPVDDKADQFRPIGLCSFVYKVISKTLENRMKPLMDKVISPNQSAFIPKRQISDNVILAHELIDSNKKNKRKIGSVAIKLDMSKAYDRLEWSFLAKTMAKLGFNPKWIRLIMNCISTVSYSVLLNGSPIGKFKPEKGLRQRDPMSPYLYIICVEALTSYIKHLEDTNLVHGIKCGKTSPSISHILFADDILLFTKATIPDFHAIKNYLQRYWWGENLNTMKRKLHLIAWENICKTKKEGGLGFRISEINNLAMMARSVWRLIENPASLLAQVLKAKYYANCDILNSQCHDKASWVWKCLHTTMNKIKPFISWVVGEGNFIDPLCDNWIPGKGVAIPKANSIPDKNLKVSDLINHDTRTWDTAKLSDVFDQSSKEMIEKIPLSSESSIDRRIWTPTKDGVFTTKSAYSTLSVRGDDSDSALWSAVWKLKVPVRIQLFVCKALKGASPVNEILHKRMHISDYICPKCKLKTNNNACSGHL
ncbi:uncharacterized protein LOC113360264 [Papaver somniferum]|uniref:uncharacterized protein LOC113360264 n=1 Tax=Papaver somniferum TaxID=3469 RepID=UPI000E6FDCD0|nr:uncharacterized protein LOC113360264 [Papaver somniferum]